MQALHDIVKAGYVRYIGMSSCYAYQCACRGLMSVSGPKPIIPSQSTLCRVNQQSLQTEYYPNSRCNAADYAITHGLTPFVSMQNNYSLVYREEEREMFPTLKVRCTLVRLTLSLTRWARIHW